MPISEDEASAQEISSTWPSQGSNAGEPDEELERAPLVVVTSPSVVDDPPEPVLSDELAAVADEPEELSSDVVRFAVLPVMSPLVSEVDPVWTGGSSSAGQPLSRSATTTGTP